VTSRRASDVGDKTAHERFVARIEAYLETELSPLAAKGIVSPLQDPHGLRMQVMSEAFNAHRTVAHCQPQPKQHSSALSTPTQTAQ